MTDPDRDDALDHLSSEELEAQAFGPDPDARRSLRGLIDRPTSGAMTVRVAEKRRRWPVVLGVVVAGIVAFAALDVALGTGGGPDVFILADGPDEVMVPLDEREDMGLFEDAVEAEADVGDGGVLSDGPEPGDAVVAD